MRKKIAVLTFEELDGSNVIIFQCVTEEGLLNTSLFSSLTKKNHPSLPIMAE